ncbi:hypothetical protein GCM10010324_02730 [Streptomyces hiroshimensis]|uniref:Uncharacterized protein n=1 Tax=Streptomyces hiroshimensis TaxID=66424 RepID=A0ABQ2Y4J3_9ACTN|nr:hypothetical protein GCM10010324_02730 [Streptomyces hiroshimensis]
MRPRADRPPAAPETGGRARPEMRPHGSHRAFCAPAAMKRLTPRAGRADNRFPERESWRRTGPVRVQALPPAQ